MKSLAIEREFGSGGREVGMLVAKKLGIPYYDSELLIKTAEDKGFDVGQLKNFDEQMVGSFLYSLALAANPEQYNQQTKVYAMFQGLRTTMIDIVGAGPAVLIGRCSTEVLRDTPNVLRSFLYCSDMQQRIDRTVQGQTMSEGAAQKLIARKDRQRENYFHFFTQRNWKDRENYDMELNTASFAPAACADILAEIMQNNGY